VGFAASLPVVFSLLSMLIGLRVLIDLREFFRDRGFVRIGNRLLGKYAQREYQCHDEKDSG